MCYHKPPEKKRKKPFNILPTDLFPSTNTGDTWRVLGKTLDNNDLNQVVEFSGFSENKGLGGVLSLAGS